MKKKLFIISAGLAIICSLEFFGIKSAYIDEIQQYLKVVIATYLASDSTSDILKHITDLLSSKNAHSKEPTA